MNGFCGMLSADSISLDKYALTKSINLIDTMQTQSIYNKNFFASVSHLKSTPLGGPRIYENKTFTFLFAGDLIGFSEIPWVDLETNFRESNFKWFSNLRGIFAFVIYDKIKKVIYLVGDLRSHLPVYYAIIDDQFIFSTSIATFTTIKSVPKFNKKWLYDYFYFNFPIHDNTCLEGVKRLDICTILSFDLNKNHITKNKYSEILKVSDNISIGEESFKMALSTFKNRVVKYYCSDRINYTALTGGFDSRTLLSLVPKNSHVKCYTYGVPGSGDLKVAKELTNTLNLNHKIIRFNEEFEHQLPDLIYQTVRLSGGTQSILRSTLPFVYKSLSSNCESEEIPIAIAGIGGDLFRGAPGSADSSLSEGMCHFYRTGKVNVNEQFFKKIFKNNWTEFESHILETFDKVQYLYGNPIAPEMAMAFDIYEITPKYFGGEYAIASNFLTMRLPYLDLEILKIAYSSEFGNLGFSPYIHDQKDIIYKKYIFQSKIICSNKDFKKSYINGIPISLYAKGNKTFFKLGRLFIRGLARLRGEKISHSRLEDWQHWCKNNLATEFKRVLNDESRILEYIEKDIIFEALKTNDIQMLNKLVTTEILLDLISNRWHIKN